MMSRAALLRTEPYRIFFAEAILLGIGGVTPWLLFGAGLSTRYLGAAHAASQMQAFMPAFAVGFLFTALPKRTQTPPASWLEIGAAALCLPVISAAAFLDHPAAAQIAYLALLVLLARFALVRLLSAEAGRRPPASFAMVPVGLLAGIGGAAALLSGRPEIASLGRAFVLEGFFTCLVLGVGAFFLPLALHGRAAPDVPRTARGWLTMMAVALAGVGVLAALAAQDRGLVRAGLAARAAITLAVFAAGGALSAPSRPGLNRRFLRLAALAVPAGLALSAVFPDHRVSTMHVFYVGGLGLLGLTVAAHVALGHGGYTADQDGRPRAVAAFGGLMIAAAAVRAAAQIVPAAYLGVLAAAAALWLAGAAVWAVYLLPKMRCFPATECRIPGPPAAAISPSPSPEARR